MKGDDDIVLVEDGSAERAPRRREPRRDPRAAAEPRDAFAPPPPKRRRTGRGAAAAAANDDIVVVEELPVQRARAAPAPVVVVEDEEPSVSRPAAAGGKRKRRESEAGPVVRVPSRQGESRGASGRPARPSGAGGAGADAALAQRLQEQERIRQLEDDLAEARRLQGGYAAARPAGMAGLGPGGGGGGNPMAMANGWGEEEEGEEFNPIYGPPRLQRYGRPSPRRRPGQHRNRRRDLPQGPALEEDAPLFEPPFPGAGFLHPGHPGGGAGAVYGLAGPHAHHQQQQQQQQHHQHQAQQQAHRHPQAAGEALWGLGMGAGPAYLYEALRAVRGAAHGGGAGGARGGAGGGGLPLPPHMLLSDRDFTDADYEALLQLDETIENRKGLKKRDLEDPKVAGKTFQWSPAAATGGGGGGAAAAAAAAAAPAAAATSCSVCLEDFDAGDVVRRTLCGHVFHKGCIDKWLLQKAECPVCRQSYK